MSATAISSTATSSTAISSTAISATAKRAVVVLLASSILFGAVPASAAETGWIADVFLVPLRSGPSNAHRIVHRGLPSGTSFEVVERSDDGSFVHIRTPAGTQGWIEAQYFTDEPIAKVQLERATARIAQLEARLSEANTDLTDVRTAHDEETSENDGLSRDVTSLQTELAELKRVSASAIDTENQRKELATLNERLRAEVDDLVAENQRLADNVQQRWMLIGAGLALAGLVAGAAIKARPRRSGWS